MSCLRAKAFCLANSWTVANGRATGEPFSIASPVRYFAPTGAAEFSVSKGGALAYRERGSVTRVARLDRDGKELGTLGASAQNARLYVSRDGRTAAFDRQQSGMGTMDVWSIDLARGVEARLTMDPGTEVGPVLIPGSHDVIFGSTKRGGPPNLVRKNLETGIEEFLMSPARALQMPEDVSPDGKVLLFSQRAEAGGNQILDPGAVREGDAVAIPDNRRRRRRGSDCSGWPLGGVPLERLGTS